MRSLLIAAAVLLAWPASPAPAASPDKTRGVKVLQSERLKKRGEKGSKPSFLKRLAAERHTRKKVDENIADQIDTLQMLIENADSDDPDLPKYLLTMGDVYWDKADTFYDRAYDLAFEKRIYAAEQDASRKDEAAKLRAEQESYLGQEKAWREKAIGVYRSIETKFPSYPDLDMVFYYLGFQLMEVERKDDAFVYFRKILERFPSSKYIPDALFHMGDYYFDKGQFDVALKLFEKVEEFPTAVAYAMALYKQGWCFYNMGDYGQALKRFLRVIIYAKSSEAKHLPFRLELEKEARNDLVRAYSEVGTPAKALRFFAKIAPEIKYELGEALAQMYFEEGQWVRSSAVYKILIKERKGSPRRLVYWMGLSENAYHEGDKELVVETVRRIMKGYRSMLDALGEADRSEIEARLEGLIKTAATAYHKEAERYDDPEVYELTAYLYEAYLALFPSRADAYEVTWNVAVLNEQVGNWDKAAKTYEKVISLQPDGAHASDAAKAILLAYYNKVEDEQAAYKGEEEIDVEPVPYPDDVRQVIRSAERYIGVAKKEDADVAKALYVLARMAYRFNHFDESVGHLQKLLERYPKSALVRPSARMILSCFALQRDVDNLDLYANRFAADPNINKGELAALIQKIRNQAGFNRCFKHDKAKEYVKTARCFLNYVEQFPSTDLKARAFFYAASAYNRAKLVEKALQTLGDLYNEMPSDPLAPSALYSIAEIFRSIAVYSESARFYELYAKRHPGHKYEKEALQRAIVFRKALRNFPQAIDDISAFVRRFRKEKVVPRLHLDRAILYGKAGNRRKAARELRLLLRRPPKGTSRAVALLARLELGRTLMALRKKKDARKAFEANVALYEQLPEDQRRKLSSEGLAAVAESHFLIGQMLLDQMSALKLKGNAKRIGKTLKEKLGLIRRATQVFAKVVAYGDRNWGIAGLARTGKAYEQLSEDIFNVPPPRGLKGELYELYRQALTEQTEAIKDAAIKSYRAALRMAITQKWFNTYTREAVRALARLDFTFSFLKEYAVRPDAIRMVGAVSPIGSYVEAEDTSLTPPAPAPAPAPAPTPAPGEGSP